MNEVRVVFIQSNPRFTPGLQLSLNTELIGTKILHHMRKQLFSSRQFHVNAHYNLIHMKMQIQKCPHVKYL